MIIFDVQIYGFRSLEADLDQSEAYLVHSVRSDGLFVFFLSFFLSCSKNI